MAFRETFKSGLEYFPARLNMPECFRTRRIVSCAVGESFATIRESFCGLPGHRRVSCIFLDAPFVAVGKSFISVDESFATIGESLQPVGNLFLETGECFMPIGGSFAAIGRSFATIGEIIATVTKSFTAPLWFLDRTLEVSDSLLGPKSNR